MSANIVIIGMRGSGKSNISRRLSVLSKRPVMSTDVLISYDTGRTIPALIEEDSGDWRRFRDLEYRTVAKVSRLTDVIVDGGGGVIVDLDDSGEEVFSERKVSLLSGSGTIVWLRGDVPRLAAKTRGDADRPPLHAIRTAEEMMYRRLPYFERAADLIVDIEGRDRKDIARQLYLDLVEGAVEEEGPDIPGR